MNLWFLHENIVFELLIESLNNGEEVREVSCT